MKKKLPLLFLTFLISPLIYGADYYWVGNTGNWSDLSHWANSSGGVGNAYITLPTIADNVFFDANSFSSNGQAITIDVDAEADSLNFSGITNTPILDGLSSITITIGGSLIFVTGFSHDFNGNYDFVSTSTETITSAGKTFNQNILLNGVGGSFALTDALNVNNEIQLQNGVFEMASFAVTATSINANNGTNTRTIDFGSSLVTISGTGTVLDLRGNTTNLSVIPGTATINFTNTDDVTVEVGDETKTIPHLTFTNCATNIQINTNSVEDNTKRTSFGNITVLTDGVNFSIDDNTDNSNIKTFESITLPNDCRYIIGSGDGTGGFGGTDHSIVTGNFTVGNNGEGDVRGRYLDIQGDYDAGTGSDCRFIRDVQFNNDFIIDGTAGGDIILDQDAEFAGNININGDARIRIDQDVNVAGNINIVDNVDAIFDNGATAPITTLTGSLILGIESTVDLGNGGDGLFTLPNITMASGAQLDINSGTSITSIGNLVLTEFNIVRFNTNSSTTITGTLTGLGSCNIWLWLKSLADGQIASVSFSSVQNVDFNICQDLNCTSTNLTNTDGVDLSNNFGVSFPTSTVPGTFFWVGSTTGNSKSGTFSTGNNDDWSNPDNWETSSGSYTGTNSCIPGAQDDVIFDANSFSAGAGNVDVDLFVQACNNISWTGIPAGCTIDNGLTSTNRELIIFGNIALNANLDNQFEGLVTFSAIDLTTRTITSNGSNFFGRVEFDFIGGSWSLIDDVDINGGSNADVTFANGTVNANAITWTIEDDWTVTNGTFTASTSTIEFDGPASNSSRQDITSNGSDFFNIHINRGTNGGSNNDQVRMSDPLTVNNDLLISRGGLFDNGFQITGSTTGQMEINNGARIILGKTDVSTVFPTNYTTANIDLNEAGQTRYNSTIAQTISNVPVYGRLYLTNRNANPLLAEKTIDGPITVNDLILIDDYNHLIDAGFQITGDNNEEIQMDPNSQMTLGTATSATEFPQNINRFDIREPSTVVYNSGLAQTIKGIAGTGTNEQYSNVIVNNAAGSGSPIKTLDGGMIIRGDLTINPNNNVDVTAANDFSIEILGDWTNNGSFIENQGIVSFTGDENQVITNGSFEEEFYDIIIDNTSNSGVTIEDSISISNAFILVNGIIYEGSDGDELVTIEDGAVVSGASDNSHVNGMVKKIGTIAFDFPIGKDTIYRPISIGVPTVSATGFKAEYFKENAHPTYDENSLAGTIDHISTCEYWILDRTTPSGNATVTLAWTPTTSCGINSLPDLTIARWDGAVWQDEGSNGSPTGTVISGTVTSASAVSSFSPFTLASTSANNPLPIDLINFTASPTSKNTVKLNWQTATEINNDYFTIERSKNGNEWEEVTRINGAGNSSIHINYNKIDPQPYFNTSYYRLKQTDFNGQFTYSKIVPVNINSEYTIAAYPNPVINYLTIRGNSNIPWKELKIYNSLGQDVTSQSEISQITEEEIIINFNRLSKGIYTVITGTNKMKILHSK